MYVTLRLLLLGIHGRARKRGRVTWVTTNPPPSRHDFTTQELYGEARERWHEMLMGKRLPPYSQNKARASEWGNATRRYLYHKYEHENMASVLSPWECRCASAGDTAACGSIQPGCVVR